MGINISPSVFDKYYEMIDSTFDIFGVTCQLVSIDKIEEIIYNPNNNIPNKISINAHKIGGGHLYDVGKKTYKEVEVLTDIKLKVYWDSKQWIGATSNIQIPDGSIQTVGMMSDLEKVLNAKSLIVHKGIKDIKEMRFQRSGEHIPIGIKQDRYFACFWSRV
ncbi:MAG: hypothetical protein EBU90_05900 [Proteobacteria bacterium]|nr:hypothetical protein [Pseudomonadota bacterium]NBP15042.1 hypothetical protein [bacterium]